MYAIKPHLLSNVIIISDNMQIKKEEGVGGKVWWGENNCF
jgi:hypothetical protein